VKSEFLMHAFIIRSGKRDVRKLEEALATCEVSSISFVPGVFFDKARAFDKNLVDLPRAELLLGREISSPEIGCALAHNEARRRASEVKDFSLILEDDAVIPYPLALRDLILIFEGKYHLTSHIVANLGINLPWSLTSERSTSELRIRSSMGASPLALAYLVTPFSSWKLLQSNTPVQYIADWPAANVKWLKLSKPLVFHGESTNQSLISPMQGKLRAGETVAFKLNRYLGIEYLVRRRDYRGFKDFLSNVWIPRVKSLLTARLGV
jgi:hypothetical protein